MMKTLLLISVLIIALIPSLLLGQMIGMEEIDEAMLSSWIAVSYTEYEGLYDFGESEAESEFVLLKCNESYYGQIRSTEWSDKANSFVMHYENLTNLKIIDNKFYSDKTNGEFVVYSNSENNVKGLKINKPWSENIEIDKYEIGTYTQALNNFFDGKYPQASKRLLNKKELINLSKLELKIMRNEIFARYGYRFKHGGEMDEYFKQQTWYRPQHDNVNPFLTELEITNIKLIRQVEH